VCITHPVPASVHDPVNDKRGAGTVSSDNPVREIRINPVVPPEFVPDGAQDTFHIRAANRSASFADCDAGCYSNMEICPRTTIPSGFDAYSGQFMTRISMEPAARQPAGVHQ
jgi:hypothetical protein